MASSQCSNFSRSTSGSGHSLHLLIFVMSASTPLATVKRTFQNQRFVPLGGDKVHRNKMASVRSDCHAVYGASSRVQQFGHLIQMLVSGHAPQIRRSIDALKDGVVCYLPKPVNDRHLIRCLRAALHSGELPEENS